MVTASATRRDGLVSLRSADLDRRLQSGAVLLGGEGPAVQEAQLLLQAHGFDPGPADGIFGSRTRGAVEAFQRSRGLSADGIIGPETHAALRTAPAEAASRRGVSRGVVPPAADRIPGQTGADFQRADADRRRRDAAAPAPAASPASPFVPAGEVTLAPQTFSEREKFDHYAAIVRAAGGEVNPAGKPTVLGIRGMDIHGTAHPSANVAAYDDVFVVLTADKRVLELPGSTHAGQTTSDKVQHVGRIDPGHYVAVPNGLYRDMPSFHVRTRAGSGNIPGVRDRNDDGRYAAEEVQRSAQRGDFLTEILFHAGFADRPSSIGCQTLSPEAMGKLIHRVGGRGFTFSLVDAR